MRYFTSDLHFRHPFVAALRGYIKPEYADSTAEDLRASARGVGARLGDMVDWETHDKDAVRSINETVDGDDEIFVLGDISSGSRRSMEGAIERLKSLNVPRSRRHLVLGNHENLRNNHADIVRLLDVFNDVSYRSSVVIADRNVLLSHFQFAYHFAEEPAAGMSTNANSARFARYAVVDDGRTLLLHGHTHAKTPFEFDNPREMNIGVDAWRGDPVSEEEIAGRIEADGFRRD